MKIIFLGYKKNRTKLIDFLKNNGHEVKEFGNQSLKKKDIISAELIICYGYNKKIVNHLLKLSKRPIINLHISYLPYNRGAHPNFWSFYENTTKGVSIHEIDSGIDTGNIIFRKEIKFKNINKLTFQNTYDYLQIQIEKLFIKNFKSIISNKYNTFRQKGKSSYHKKKELPKNLKTWNTNILKYLSH